MDRVRVDHVSKRFLLRRDRADSVGKLLVRMIPRRRGHPPETLWALQDVTFAVPERRSLGIVGDNGSGKSTLLKILTRTMVPTEGHVHVRGRLSALIELGAGFHPDFTGRENVYLNASLLGIPRQEVDRSFDAIVDFAGIPAFIDTPVKYYSSGMQARLGFSVAIHVKPQVLLVDEVLSVGDAAFQEKCMERIHTLKAEGVSIVFVSHDLGSVERLMDEAIWIEKGVVRASGSPKDVVARYREKGEPSPEKGKDLHPPSPLVLEGLRVEGHGSGERLEVGVGALFHLDLRNAGEVSLTALGSLRIGRGGVTVAELSVPLDAPLALPPGRTRVIVTVGRVWLTPGAYTVDVHLHLPTGEPLVEARASLTFQVTGSGMAGGLVLLPHAWRVL